MKIKNKEQLENFFADNTIEWDDMQEFIEKHLSLLSEDIPFPDLTIDKQDRLVIKFKLLDL